MKSPGFTFYPRDWICSGAVAEMTGDQVKAYMYLLSAAWLQDDRATLPADDDRLAALARVSRETWDVTKPLIMTKFTKNENGRLVNDRLWAEHQKQLTNSRKGSKNAAKRHQKDAKELPNSYQTPANSLPNRCQTDATA